jgi:ankyrin repeat protein
MTTQNRYQIVKELGRHPEGRRVTSLGIDTSVNPPVKVVLKEFCFAQQDANCPGFKAYQKEIAVLRSLNHPRVPSYKDSFETPAGFCLVQEYKEASSLDKVRIFKAKDIKQIAVAVLEILVALQGRVPPVIHLNIKPENILIDKQKKVYLTDFGLSRLGKEKNAPSSSCAGTIGFMSPEQVFDRPLSKGADIYSLGATLITLVSKTRSKDIGNLIADNNGFDLKGVAPQLNPLFMRWLKKMVEPNVKHRFPNAEAALKALQPISLSGKASQTEILRARWEDLKLSPEMRSLIIPLEMIRDRAKNLRLSPEMRSRTIALGSGTLIIAALAFLIPKPLKYPIIQFFGGKPIAEMCEEIRWRESNIGIDYLKWGGNPNATTEESRDNLPLNTTLLECALNASNTNKNLVKQLIDRGADVNVVSKNTNTPLQLIAIKEENLSDLAKLLIAKGAKVNVENRWKKTPLSMAIDRGNTELSELLISNGANVNIKEDRGDKDTIPLLLAISKNQGSIAKLLISKGARIDVKDFEGRNSLHTMAVSNFTNQEVMEILIAKTVGINDKDNKLNTPLWFAVETGKHDMAKLLIAKKAQVNVKNSFNRNLLHLANDLELTKLLLDKGADVNARDAGGFTPLRVAIERKNDLELIKLLLAKGANINAKDSIGNTPLHIAAALDRFEEVELLLQKGADVNAKNDDGKTPLNLAVAYRNPRIITIIQRKMISQILQTRNTSQ